ncbi:TPA: GNAT family N-acetyltransferase [Serratia marcescens]|uniref:GNAT family N-acetyltransferase n=1 Tax=Serratia bockelmannii TaxID=2703793 RepID=UPI0038C949D4
MIELKEMTAQELDHYRKYGVKAYADDLARSFQLSQEHALIEAEANFKRGLAMPGQRLVCARLPNVEDSIATVWYAIEQRTFGKQLFIYDFEVTHAWRGKGYGERVLNAVLDAARAQGVEYAELTVFNDNPTAARLYSKLGFDAVTTRMRRRL